MQIESNQSKLSLGWLPLCEFKTNILFLIFFLTQPVLLLHHLRAVLVLYLMLNWCFSAFFATVLLQTNSLVVCKRRSLISVEWIDRFVRRKRWIISAVAKVCREVVWHRHWLSLLRSEGIAGLSWETKRETKEKSEQAKEQNCKLDRMRCKCPVGVLVLCNTLFRLDKQSVVLP